MIENNRFVDMHQGDGSVAHTDAIQLYGSAETKIRGNFWSNVAVCIMAADGADHEVIENNVCVTDGYNFGITVESDDGSIIRHNTMPDLTTDPSGQCEYGGGCGRLYLGNKSGDPVSSGTVVKDNILGSICVCAGSVKGVGAQSHNLIANPGQSAGGLGPNDLAGRPTFQGGAVPGTLEGYRLSPLSLGSRTASDGLDRGALIP